MTSIRFDNQVVLVTGADRGLGAAYAQLFAKRGASVIVHDAGGNRDGTGGDPGPALSVARSIKANGGTALVETLNLSDQAACKALIDNAITKCGRLDVLVHSAGLVAYKGTVSGYGLKTFDGSDVIAYGVGKAAQFGLMNGLAGEGQQHGILVNAISPIAATHIFRRTVAPNELSPASVAPGVVLLGSSMCPFTGKVLQAAGGKFAISEFNSIKEFELGQFPTPEQVLQAFEPDHSGSNGR